MHAHSIISIDDTLREILSFVRSPQDLLALACAGPPLLEPALCRLWQCITTLDRFAHLDARTLNAPREIDIGGQQIVCRPL